MKKTVKFVIFLLVCLSLFSCRREEMSVSKSLAQPFVTKELNYGLSFYVNAKVPSKNDLSMTVTDPSGNFTWSFKPQTKILDSVEYVGHSSLSMPKGVVLPKGIWTFEIMFKDGRSIKENFDIDYNFIDETAMLFESEKLPFFDFKSNLTLLEN